MVYDNAGNSEKTEEIKIRTTKGNYSTITLQGIIKEDSLADDALTSNVYDRKVNTEDTMTGGGRYIKVASECWGKYITIYCNTQDYKNLGYGCIYFYENKEGEPISGGYLRGYTGIPVENICARSVIIPEGTNWIRLGPGTNGGPVFHIREMWCSEENLSGNVYTNETLASYAID